MGIIINDIKFFNKFMGFSVGTGGTILKSIDEGETWNILNFDSTNTLTNLWITNDLLGYIGSDQNYFLKTLDGGITWNVINTDFSNGYRPTYICFPSEEIGYSIIWGWTIYKTIDGGLHWVEKLYTPTNGYQNLCFINPDTGFVPGANFESGKLLVKTYNGLNSWGLSLHGPPYQSSLTDVFFINNNTGYVTGGDGKINYTTNCGNSWQEQNTPTTSTLNSIHFPTETTGYAVGTGGTILKTTNGGITGTNYSINNNNKDFYLHQNYPNPFNPSTFIKYTLPKSEKVNIEIFNLLGKKITTLVNKVMPAGLHEVEFKANELPSGVYFYRIVVGNFQDYKKMILLR